MASDTYITAILFETLKTTFSMRLLDVDVTGIIDDDNDDDKVKNKTLAVTFSTKTLFLHLYFFDTVNHP